MMKIITAIDIGTTKIVAIAGEVTEKGKVRILGMGSVPTPKGSVKRGVPLNVDQVSQAVKKAIDSVQEKTDIKFKEVYIGIAGVYMHTRQTNHSVMIESKEFEITKDDVDKMIFEINQSALDPGDEILHVIPQEFIVDANSGIHTPIGMFGKRLSGNFNIIIGKVISSKHIRLCVERLNLNAKKLFLEPLASSRAVLTSEEKEAGVALVDIGGGTTDLAVYYEGILRYTAVIPFGGDVITTDLKVGCKILHNKAETLKVQHGVALSEFADNDTLVTVEGINGREAQNISVKLVAEIIQARVEEICEIIDLELLQSGYRDRIGAGISLTGGGALLKHLPQLMKYRLGLDVKLSRPGVNLVTSTRTISNPKYSTAVGLIMLGIEEEQQFEFESLGRAVKKNIEEQNITNEAKVDEKEELEKDDKSKNLKAGGRFSNFKQTLLQFINDNDKEL